MNEPGSIEIEFGVPIPGKILPSEQWAKTAIKKLPPAGPLDWQAIFGRTAPVILDLGCGNGRFVVTSAVRRPACDHVGLDILPVVIRYATRRGNQRGLHNTRFAVCGAFDFLEQYVAPQSVQEIHIYHPQPFRDAEKAYRRLITPEFLGLVHRALNADGLFVLQTDNNSYWKYVTSIVSHFFDFQIQTGPWPEDPQGRTRREIMARARGLPIFRGFGKPLATLTTESISSLIQKLPLPQFLIEDPPPRRSGGRRKSRRR